MINLKDMTPGKLYRCSVEKRDALVLSSDEKTLTSLPLELDQILLYLGWKKVVFRPTTGEGVEEIWAHFIVDSIARWIFVSDSGRISGATLPADMLNESKYTITFLLPA